MVGPTAFRFMVLSSSAYHAITVKALSTVDFVPPFMRKIVNFFLFYCIWHGM